ncbi:hypothetical protein niasHT_016850 [Heterodera trifolii]|uniref:Peptidase M41 domain-containing protein n=1 Tax=Heterodera trifolii TaxID=157864 RepID=A0ABD2KTE4_9BILA
MKFNSLMTNASDADSQFLALTILNFVPNQLSPCSSLAYSSSAGSVTPPLSIFVDDYLRVIYSHGQWCFCHRVNGCGAKATPATVTTEIIAHGQQQQQKQHGQQCGIFPRSHVVTPKNGNSGGTNCEKDEAMEMVAEITETAKAKLKHSQIWSVLCRLNLVINDEKPLCRCEQFENGVRRAHLLHSRSNGTAAATALGHSAHGRAARTPNGHRPAVGRGKCRTVSSDGLSGQQWPNNCDRWKSLNFKMEPAREIAKTTTGRIDTNEGGEKREEDKKGAENEDKKGAENEDKKGAENEEDKKREDEARKKEVDQYKKEMSSADRKLLSTHEASHSAIARASGAYIPTYLRMNCDCTGAAWRRPIPRCKTVKQLKMDVVIEYSGRAAELKLIGEATSGSGKDITKATDIIMSITRSLAMSGGPGRTWLNYEIATPSASDLEWFRAREQEISIECQTEAEKQVDKHWDCISALATALDESPMWEMNEDELKKFFDEWDAKNARPAAALPVTDLPPGTSNAPTEQETPTVIGQTTADGQNVPPLKKAKNDTGVDEDGEKYC